MGQYLVSPVVSALPYLPVVSVALPPLHGIFFLACSLPRDSLRPVPPQPRPSLQPSPPLSQFGLLHPPYLLPRPLLPLSCSHLPLVQHLPFFRHILARLPQHMVAMPPHLLLALYPPFHLEFWLLHLDLPATHTGKARPVPSPRLGHLLPTLRPALLPAVHLQWCPLPPPLTLPAWGS